MLTRYHLIFECLSLIAAIYCYRGLRHSVLKWMPLFLFINIVAELCAAYIVLYVPEGSTFPIYNALVPLSALFYGYILHQSCKGVKRKMFILITMAIFSLYALLNYFLLQGSHVFNDHTALAGWIWGVFCCCLFFDEFFRNDSNTAFARSVFWIAAGLLVYNSGNSICLSLYDYIKNNNLTLFGQKLYTIVPRLLSVVLYSCFAIAFIICRKSSHQTSISP